MTKRELLATGCDRYRSSSKKGNIRNLDKFIRLPDIVRVRCSLAYCIENAQIQL